MTQPSFAQLSTIYTRALRLLGLVPAQRQLQTPLTVSSVQIVADASDFSIPHSNPIFGMNVTTTAVLNEFSVIRLTATTRVVRIRRLNVIAGTSNRLQVVAGVHVIDTVQVGPLVGLSLGPQVNVGTADFEGGVVTATDLSANAYRPNAESFDLRPPLLVAKGSSFVMEDRSSNVQGSLSIIWEEIPDQSDVTDVGFPEIQ